MEKLFRLSLSYVLLFTVLHILNISIGFGGIVLIVAACFLIAGIRYIDLRRHLRHREKRGRPGWIYGFTDVGQIIPLIKIGRSSSEKSRLSSHATAAPFGMVVYFNFRVNDAVYVERLLHTRYRAWWIRREWYGIGSPIMLCEIILLRLFGAGI